MNLLRFSTLKGNHQAGICGNVGGKHFKLKFSPLSFHKFYPGDGP